MNINLTKECKVLLGINFFGRCGNMRLQESNYHQNPAQQESSPPETPVLLPYDPNRLLDALMVKLNVRNDAALSRALDVLPPVISKIRHRKLPVGASMLIRMHEESGWSIRELRDLMGDRRKRVRMSDAEGKPKAPKTEE